ncbi:MAG: hypothetical protein OEX97_11725 [Acidimicrobiia bacterium]|nr:hypothetical protein [Acidimicrobiia bacterium]MDH5503314.1 hypothetical protein [Acidimicrobiia bacterium]
MIDQASQTLADELVTAYAPFVASRTESLELDLVETLDAGEAWLREELTTELSRPYDQQRRGPLEIFQAAMSFPTEVLLAAGVEEPRRDAMAVQALPGDRFNLAPASSRDISDEVWTAHLAWGVTKAAAMKGVDGPSVI